MQEKNSYPPYVKVLSKKFPKFSEIGVVPDRWKTKENETDNTRFLSNVLARLDKLDSRSGKVKDSLVATFKKKYSDQHILDEANLDDSYILQKLQVEKNLGLGRDIQQGSADFISHKRREYERIVDEQRESLGLWLDYLTENTPQYPVWFRVLVLLEISKYSFTQDKVLKKRTSKTVAPFIQLNPEVLALVYEEFKALEGSPGSDNNLVQTGALAKMYLDIMEVKVGEKAVTLIETNANKQKGEWRVFHHGQHQELAESLREYNTGLCIAGSTTAESYLRSGPVHVFYGYDASGVASIPKVAISFINGKVSEVRGTESGQNIDPVLSDEVATKLKTLDGGVSYDKKVEHMNLLTVISEKVDKGEKLTLSEIEFLYEIKEKIIGFGLRKDPRIKEIRSKYKFKENYASIVGLGENQIADRVEDLKEGVEILVANLHLPNLKKSVRIPSTLKRVIGNITSNIYNSTVSNLENIEYISGDLTLDEDEHLASLGKLSEVSGNVTIKHSKLASAGKLKRIGGSFDCSSSFTDLGDLEEIGEDAKMIFFGGTTLGKLRKVGGILRLGSTRIRDLSSLEEVGVIDIVDSQVKKVNKDLRVSLADKRSEAEPNRLGVRLIGGVFFWRGRRIMGLDKWLKHSRALDNEDFLDF